MTVRTPEQIIEVYEEPKQTHNENHIPIVGGLDNFKPVFWNFPGGS